MRWLPLLLLACAARAGEPGFRDIFDPDTFTDGADRTPRQQGAFEEAARREGLAAAVRAFRRFEPALDGLRSRAEKEHASYLKVAAEWWGWRRQHEAQHQKRYGRPPADYPVPPGLNKAFLDREKSLKRARSLLLRERLFQEWSLARTEELLGGGDRGRPAEAVTSGLGDRAPEQRLRCVRLARALGLEEQLRAAAKRESHPGVLAALAEAVPAPELLAHEHWPVRAGAIRGAERAGTREAAGWLVARLEAEDGRLRDDLVDALRRMSGEEAGYDPARWKAWLEGLPAEWRARAAPPAEPGVFSDGPVSFFGIASSTRAAVYCVQVSAGWEAVREGLLASVATLPEGALFGVVAYDAGPHLFRKQLAEANGTNREALARWLEKVGPGGGPDTHAALQAALDLAVPRAKEAPAADTLFLAAPSKPGEAALFDDPQQVMLEVRARNSLLGLRIHAVGRSGGGDSHYLQGLCAPFGGRHLGE